MATKLAVAVPSAVIFEQEVAKGPVLEASLRTLLVAGVGLGVWAAVLVGVALDGTGGRLPFCVLHGSAELN